MAWTTPKTWATDEIVLATGTGSLNEQIRDNLNALSVHAHSGGAGDGSSALSAVSLGQLNTVVLSDQSADPTNAGEMMRNGTALKYHNGSAVIDLTLADQAAGTPSLRSLGSTGVTAAAGKHQHQISQTEVANTLVNFTFGAWGYNQQDEKQSNSGVQTYTATNANNLLSFSWMLTAQKNFGGVAQISFSYTARLKYNGSTVKTVSGLNSWYTSTNVNAHHIIAPSTSAINYEWTVRPDSPADDGNGVNTIMYAFTKGNITEAYVTV